MMGDMFRMTGIIIQAVILFGFCAMAAEQEAVIEIGNRNSIDSEILERKADLTVHLPVDYASGESRYPVLFMMGSEWRTRFAMWASYLDYMSGGGQIPSMILIGIDLPEGNGVLLPRGEDTSGPDRHIRFLVDEVIPFVDTKYRTMPYRILFGASNSGLFSVYTLLTEPGAFNAYIASSPMLGWCEDLIKEKAEKAFAGKGAPARFLYIIYSDDDYERVTEYVPAFVFLLKEKRPSWLEFESVVRSNEGHVPAVDIPFALKALFPDFNPGEELTSLEAMKNHYSKLTKKYGFEIQVPAALLFDFGIEHVMAKRLDQAEPVFEYSVKLYPHHARSYVGLGLVRREQSRNDEARILFGRALEFDPEDSLARRLLDRLEEQETATSTSPGH